MKFKLIERFKDEETKKSHYDKHVSEEGKSKSPRGIPQYEFTTLEFEDPNEYEEYAEKLANTPCEFSAKGEDRNELGIHAFRGYGKGSFADTYYKYDSATGMFTAYYIKNNEIITLTFHLISKNRWIEKIAKYYVSEVENNEDIVK